MRIEMYPKDFDKSKGTFFLRQQDFVKHLREEEQKKIIIHLNKVIG